MGRKPFAGVDVVDGGGGDFGFGEAGTAMSGGEHALIPRARQTIVWVSPLRGTAPPPRMAPMATYVYETIPAKSGEKPRHFEIKQSMTEAALTRHPDTGEPIRRVVTGGFGLMGTKAAPSSGGGGAPSKHRGGSCGCGAGGCHN